jgi:putative transposase
MVAPYARIETVPAGQADTAIFIPVTNAIESLHSCLRKAVRVRGHFPTDEAASKLLFLVLREVSRDWKMAAREWNAAKTQFAVMFGDRFSAE